MPKPLPLCSRAANRKWRGRAIALQSHDGGIAADRSAVRYLLFLNLRDCLHPTRLCGGKRNLVASVHGIQRQASLCFEVLRCAACIRTTGPALRLLNCDDAIDPVNLGNNSGLGLLGQSRRADERERRSTSQNNFCDFQGSLPASGQSGTISRALNGSPEGTSVDT